MKERRAARAADGVTRRAASVVLAANLPTGRVATVPRVETALAEIARVVIVGRRLARRGVVSDFGRLLLRAQRRVG